MYHACCRSFLQRQYQLKLRRRAKEVQEKLTEDLHLLEKLMSMEMEENRRASEQQEAARREMLCARQALAEQARVEREREKHMEFLFKYGPLELIYVAVYSIKVTEML